MDITARKLESHKKTLHRPAKYLKISKTHRKTSKHNWKRLTAIAFKTFQNTVSPCQTNP
jgi:predicted AlkP superfamily phosphohydrolase/phosphomutase